MTPLTVAYVGNFTRPWCTEVHVAASLEALGHNVMRLQENHVNWRALPALVAGRRAHLLLWTRTWGADPDEAVTALDRLRAAGVPSASFHLDRWWGLDREYQVTSDPFFRTDVVFSPDGGSAERWEEAGIRHVWLPPGVYEAEACPGTPARRVFPHDVVFVGTHPYPHREWAPVRARMLDFLAERYGERFKVWPEPGAPIRGARLASLYASARVVVGDSCLVPPVAAYWSDRVPETLGRGGYLVHPHVSGIEEWYPDLPTFPVGDHDVLGELIDRALDDDELRRRTIEKNQALVLARDTYRHRMASVIEHVERLVGLGTGDVAHVAGPVEVRHGPSRQRGRFDLAQGDSDGVAVREVWTDDTYQLDRGQVAGGTVIDVGANVGAFSVLAARMGAARVLAYEPQPAACRRLLANADLNAVAARVEAHDVAVMDEPGKVYVEGDGGGAHIEFGRPMPADYEPARWVEAVGINDVLRDAGDTLLLKIDCEGAEYPIIDGLDVGLLQTVRRIVMEFHGPGMPHLTHLNDDGRHEERWGAMVAKLAGSGRVRIFGRPMVGGLLWWERF